MKWYTPNAEKVQAKSWTTWEEYQNKLRRQFGLVNARDQARAKIRKLKQGQSSMTDYWNDFRRIASTAQMDGATMFGIPHSSNEKRIATSMDTRRTLSRRR